MHIFPYTIDSISKQDEELNTGLYYTYSIHLSSAHGQKRGQNVVGRGPPSRKEMWVISIRHLFSTNSLHLFPIYLLIHKNIAHHLAVYFCGFLFLPFLWLLNVLYFGPELRRRREELGPLVYQCTQLERCRCCSTQKQITSIYEQFCPFEHFNLGR
jgi:hypothetical protein